MANSKVPLKKTAAMLSSPWSQSEPKNGIIYITFDDNGVNAGDEVQNVAQVTKKKKEVGTDDQISEVNAEDSIVSECVYEPEEDYGQGDAEDEVNALANDDY